MVTAFFSRARGFKVKSRAGQIGHSVADGSAPLRYFFKRRCAARGAMSGDGPRQLVTPFGAMHRV